MAEAKTTKLYRTFTGEVVSRLMDKTAVVKVGRTPFHKKYGKQYKVTTKYKVHDEKNECVAGDKIKFRECRPLSKDKRWRFIEKVS